MVIGKLWLRLSFYGAQDARYQIDPDTKPDFRRLSYVETNKNGLALIMLIESGEREHSPAILLEVVQIKNLTHPVSLVDLEHQLQDLWVQQLSGFVHEWIQCIQEDTKHLGTQEGRLPWLPLVAFTVCIDDRQKPSVKFRSFVLSIWETQAVGVYDPTIDSKDPLLMVIKGRKLPFSRRELLELVQVKAQKQVTQS